VHHPATGVVLDRLDLLQRGSEVPHMDLGLNFALVPTLPHTFKSILHAREGEGGEEAASRGIEEFWIFVNEFRELQRKLRR
jgi:hypothetical protein